MHALLIVAICVVGLTTVIDAVCFILTEYAAEFKAVSFNLPPLVFALVALAIALGKLP